ncbi:myosin light chain kinase, smooth muscle isoform X2 [Eucyclogobius newberryi]|uniref:myosin light chain kinase, smooth muscle isoform X2 n=1 Tax=Eucyclogobius newberryi TaxID=166745 RepID=UPI003B59E773
MNGETARYVSTYRMHFKTPAATVAMETSCKSGIKLRRSGVTNSGSSSVGRPEAPVFARPLEDICVDEGTDFTLSATVRGTQPIRVSWMHNDFETICGVRRQASSAHASPTKCIVGNGGSPLSAADEVATSPAGSESPATSPREVVPKKRASSGTVVLLCFQNPPQHLEVKAGERARLTCSFVGSAPVVSCWIRSKQQIVEDSQLWLENSETSSTLVIAAAQAQHSDRYTLLVKDRHGSAQHTLTLSVVERPQPPASGPVVSLVSGSIPVLSWSGPCYDGGSAVLGYVVEVKERHSADWTEISHNCTSTSYRVTSGLEPRAEYSFRVKAFNTAGSSDAGPESAPFTMDEKDGSSCRTDAPAAYSPVTIDSTHKVSDHYILQEKLGVGRFGHVYKLTRREDGRVCAGKFYKGRRSKEREAARREMELMMNYLHHPKLVRCLGAYDHRPEMVMIMEFIAGGELFERIVDDSFEHTETTSARFMQQILEGVAFMHQQKILHLDLKPENIVCVDTSGTQIKIIDFGLASRLDDKAPLKVMQGTPEFVAPEVINYEPVSPASDMWSIGVICYILLSGESPFQGNSDAETLALVTAAQYEFDEDSFEEITEDAKSFISSLLNKAPRRRLSCAEALSHPWMAAFDSEDTASSKSLSKDKMKKFLARQKWKKAGKAMLALKRMALLSRSESSASSSAADELPLSPEAEDALQTLERKMQGPPRFTEFLQDQTTSPGSAARLSCHLTGYPDPEVVWLRGDDPVVESASAEIEYEEDGRCTLVLSDVSAEDAGLYTCRATNDHGEAACSARLIVPRQ